MRCHFLTAITFFLLMLLNTVNTAYGFNQADMAIHGFVSQGYLRSSDNNYLGQSKDGSFQFNEIGINFNTLLTDELRFGAQLFSRDLGEYGNNELIVDWAFLDYAYQDWLGFRAGRVKTPYGLYNNTRYADMLRTSILMPQSVYNEGIRMLANAFYGVSVYGNVNLNFMGLLDYEFYGGTVDIPPGAPFAKDLLLLREYTDPVAYNYFTNTLGVNPDKIGVDLRHVEGGMLNWNTPLSGLRFRMTDMKGKGSYGLGAITLDLNLEQFSVVSAEYDIADLLFAAEYFILDFDVETPGVRYNQKMEGYYGTVNWDMLEWVTLGVSYGEYFPYARDKDGDGFKDVIPDFWAWQKDITLSVRFNINEYFCVKLETHFYDGTGLASVDDNRPPDNAEQNWILYAFKTSLNF